MTWLEDHHHCESRFFPRMSVAVAGCCVCPLDASHAVRSRTSSCLAEKGGAGGMAFSSGVFRGVDA